MGKWDKYGDYNGYLQSPEWKALRGVILRQSGYRCQICNGEGNLSVHHRTYELGDSEDGHNLIVLCDECHKLYELGGKYIKDAMSRLESDLGLIRRDTNYMKALMGMQILGPNYVGFLGSLPSGDERYDLSGIDEEEAGKIIAMFKRGHLNEYSKRYYIILNDVIDAIRMPFKRALIFIRKTVIGKTVLGSEALFSTVITAGGYMEEKVIDIDKIKKKDADAITISFDGVAALFVITKLNTLYKAL